MKILLTFVLVIMATGLHAAEWKALTGIYAVTPKNYMDPSESEQKDSHYRIQFKGASAKDLYLAIKVAPVKDECTGALAKNIGEMQCLYFQENARYECHFSINIAKQKIEYGVAC